MKEMTRREFDELCGGNDVYSPSALPGQTISMALKEEFSFDLPAIGFYPNNSTQEPSIMEFVKTIQKKGYIKYFELDEDVCIPCGLFRLEWDIIPKGYIVFRKVAACSSTCS